MSIFSRNTEARSQSYQDVWSSGGPWSSGLTQERALSLAPAYSAIRLIAEALASLPIKQYETRGNERLEIDPPTPFLQERLGEQTVFAWKYQIVTSLALCGNAFGLITSLDPFGMPDKIIWLNPDDVTIELDSVLVTPRWSVNGRPIDSASLVHIPLLQPPGKILGLSPIKAFRELMEAGLSAQKFNKDFYDNGSIPSGVLQVDGKVDQAESNLLKRRFKAATVNRDVVVLGVGTEYNPISMSAQDAQFLDSIKANATMIAAIYGVPAEDIGGASGKSMTYANEEQHSLRFVNFTLRPWIVRIESALDLLVPAGQFVRFSVDAMLRTDLAARYASYEVARRYGLLSVDEIRALEERPPLPGNAGNDYTALEAIKNMKGVVNNGGSA